MNLNIYELDELLMQVETIFDGWKLDADWTDGDENVRQKLLAFRTQYTYRPVSFRWHEAARKEDLQEGDTVPLRCYADLCRMIDKKNVRIIAQNKQLDEFKDQVADRDAEIEELKERLKNAEHYAAKKELELLRLSQMPDEGGQEKRGQKINTNHSAAEQSDAAAIAPMQCYAGEAEPLPAKAYCSECGMAVNSSHQQHYHWCSLAGNGA